MTNSIKQRRVVVTGYGSVTPMGMTAQQSWAAIMDYQFVYRYYDISEQGIKSRFFGLLDAEPNLKAVPAAIRRRLPRYARLALAAAREAMAMAFAEKSPADYYDLLDCGTIIGSGWAGQDETHDNYEVYL